VVNFIRLEKPVRPGQLSECFGAGTGCGWCRPFLVKLFEQAQAGETIGSDLPDREQYAHDRGQYIEQGQGKPPPQTG
jgi:bacterioferritin-associated ferredoxin